MTINNIFSVPVFSTFLNVDLNKLQNMVYEEENKDKEGQTLSNTGYQTKDQDLKKYKFLLDQIQPHALNFFKEFNYNAELFLINFWFNINRHKDMNKLHAHPRAHISGVFYIKTPEESGNIVFENPNWNIDSIWVDENIAQRNPYNHQSYFIKGAENLLIMFPGYLRHYVDSNKSKQDRISMSFNLGCRLQ